MVLYIHKNEQIIFSKILSSKYDLLKKSLDIVQKKIILMQFV